MKEVAPTIESFRASGIGSILDLAMEADLDSGVSLVGQAAQEHAAKIAVMMKESVNIAATTPGNFIAAKVTAFVPPGTLLRWSTTVTHLKKTFELCAQTDSNGKLFLDSNGFSRFVSHFPAFPKDKVDSHYQAMDKAGSGHIDFTDISAHFSLFNTQNASYLLQKPSSAESLPHTTFVNQEDLDTAALVLKELSGLCSYAREKRVKIMIDAEQTYFQPAIDDIALSLCQKFNEPLNAAVKEGSLKSALVYNTYQMYLRDANDRLRADIERANRFGYIFGVKLVRGKHFILKGLIHKQFLMHIANACRSLHVLGTREGPSSVSSRSHSTRP